MFYIDNDSGVTVMPPVSAQRSAIVRWFSEGDGNNVITWPGMDWFNIVQAELLNTLEEAGIQPDKTKLNQLALSIKAIMSNNALLIKNNLSEIKTAGASAQRTARENLDIYDASLNKKGLVQLTSSTNSTSETLAATAKAVKIAMDNANARLAKDRNGADIPNKPLFIQNVGLQETVNRAGNAVQRSGDKMTGKLTLPQTSAFGVNTNNVLGGNSIAFGDNDTGIKQNGDGILDVYANGQHVFRFQNGEVQSTTRTMKVSGALNVSGNTILLGNMNIFGAIAATGQVIPSDYRNFDARYQKRNGGVQDIRLGNQRVDGHYNDDFTVPSGHVVTGGDVAPSSALKLYSRPVQKLINGTWYNVASI